jgi:malate permease and related proteins
MAELLNTIVPIFIVIGVGLVAGQRGYLPDAFLGPANRLVYHLAIPAMIFRAVATGDLQRQFNLPVLVVCLGTVATGYGIAHGAGRLQRLSRAARATFTQTAFHGNLGYVGLAVVFFHLGDEALGRAGILAGFIMILQNLLAVVALSSGGEGAAVSRWRRVMGNPVIVTALLGIGFSAAGFELPRMADQSLAIIARMALPLALLVIGATLSLHQIRSALKPALAASGIKLVVLPAIALVMFRGLMLAPEAYLPALILLASPTATVAYVMGREMGGDTNLAAAVISLSTLMSGVTFLVWLSLVE